LHYSLPPHQTAGFSSRSDCHFVHPLAGSALLESEACFPQKHRCTTGLFSEEKGVLLWSEPALRQPIEPQLCRLSSHPLSRSFTTTPLKPQSLKPTCLTAGSPMPEPPQKRKGAFCAKHFRCLWLLFSFFCFETSSAAETLALRIN